MSSERLSFISWMKCVGMLLIVYGHVATAAPFNTVPPINTKQIGVAFFLFATGFTLARENRDRWYVLFNRLFEMYLLGIAVALVVSAVGYAAWGKTAKSNYLPFVLGVNVLFNFFPANPTTWYIGGYAHLLLSWALVWRRYRIRPWMLAAALPLEIAIRAALLGAGLHMVAYMMLSNWTTVFLLGMWAGQREAVADRERLPRYVAALAALMIGWELFTMGLDLHGDFPFMRLAGEQTAAKFLFVSTCVSFVYLAFTWLAFQVARRLSSPPVVHLVARNTVFIFIAHMPVYYTFMALSRGWTASYWLKAGVRLILCFFVLALVSEALMRLAKVRDLRAASWSRLQALRRPVAPQVAAIMLTVTVGAALVGAAAPSAAPLDAPLLQESNLVYQGAFRLPRGRFCLSPHGVTGSFTYGGSALAYDPTRDGLYLVGHDHDQMTAEISIPTPINAGTVSALKTAKVLQACVDATESKIRQAGEGAKIGGQMVYNGMLYGTVYVYYDAGKSQTVSHFVRPLDLSVTGQVRGLFELVAPHAGFVAGYLSPIPSEWQSALGGPAFTGQCCIPIISRTSYGPAAFAFDPVTLGASRRIRTVPLVYYDNLDDSHAFVNDWNVQSRFFNGATAMGGAVFVAGTRTVLFVGRQGLGPFCYGSGGTSGGDCYDPTSIYKGSHAYPYVYQIWAYDAADLAAVASRRRRPWTVRPYGLWTVDFPLAVAAADIKGATYDPATRRLFLTQAGVDGGDMPLVHVFQASFRTDGTPR